MINFLRKYKFLILILLLAGFLRLYKLNVYPALNADEAAIGYNAYSLIQTGSDEHGNPWPIHFQSFNDYKPGAFFYMVLPFVKVLGLNVWAIRIPGALFGVLSVLFIYLLAKELFGDEKFASVAALFLAISPWHIQFSRGGWEVNAATCFIVLSIYLFLKSLKKNFSLGYLIASMFFVVLSLYTYHAARVVAPLLVLGVLVIYRKNIFTKRNIKTLVISGAFGILLVSPLVKDLVSSGALSRVAGVGLFADPGPINRINEQRGEHGNINSFLGTLIHNKFVNYGLAFANNWGSHFSGEFLFMTGDSIERNKVPETGELYLFDLIFLIVGLIFISKNFKPGWKVIIWWLAVAPVASALTFQAPNALRSQIMAIPLVIISAYGFVRIIDALRGSGKKIMIAGYLLIAVVMLWGFFRYEHMYWAHMSKEFPFSSQYGLKELVIYLSQEGDKYKEIVVTDRYDQPYILFLFYLKYSPSEFQAQGKLSPRDKYGFSTVRSFDRYRFLTFGSWDEIKNTYPGDLIVGTPDEIPKEANVVKRIYGTNGYEYFDVVAN